MVNTLSQPIYIINWIFLILIFKYSFQIVLEKNLKSQYVRPISYLLPILLYGYYSWLIVWVRLPHFFLYIPIICSILLCGINRFEFFQIFLRDKKWDLIFLLFFFLFLLSIAINPDVNLFYDRATSTMFVASIINNLSVPPLDTSYYGGYLDLYYYFIYWVFASVGIVTGTPISFINGFGFSFICSSSIILCYALGKLIIPRFWFLPILILIIPRPSMFYIFFTTPNIHSFLELISKTAYIIPDLDYDCQLTGTVYGNIHPMIGSIGLRLLVLFLLIVFITKREQLNFHEVRLLLGLLSISAGLLFISYAWDALIFGPLLVIFYIWLIIRTYQTFSIRKQSNYQRINLFLNYVFPLIPGILFVLIWLIPFQPLGFNGFVYKLTPINFIVPLLIHGWLIGVLFIYCYRDIISKPIFLLLAFIPVIFGDPALSIFIVPLIYLIIKKGKKWFDFFAIWSLIIFIICEYFTVVTGIMPDRANTVLKLTWISWPVMWVSIFGIINSWINQEQNCKPHLIYSRLWHISIIAVMVFVIIFIPFYSYGSIEGLSLDGASKIEKSNPSITNVVKFLNDDPNLTYIIEGVNNFSTSDISVLTGISNYLQYPGVEKVWGRDINTIDSREKMIKEIYTNSNFSFKNISKIHPSYILLSEREKQIYGNISINKSDLMEVFSDKSTIIFKILK